MSTDRFKLRGVGDERRAMRRRVRFGLCAATALLFAACTAVVPAGGTGGATEPPADAGGGATGGATGATGTTGGASGTGGKAAGGGGNGGAGSRDAGADTVGGGAAGAGALDAGRDIGGGSTEGGAVVALCPPSALVCEDFEDGKADGWSALATGMTIGGARAAHGSNSLTINIPANQRGGMITFKGAPLFPLMNKVMWGRVMVWFDSISDGHTDIIRGQAASGGNPTYNVAEQHGAYMLNYYNGSSATDCWARPMPPTPTVVPLGKWACWEWRFDAANNDMQFFVDGALYRRAMMTGDGCLTGNGVWVAPPDFGLVGVGATIAELRPTVMQMSFDDIAIGTEARIGCPAP